MPDAGDGRADVADTQAGSRVAQFSANCSDNPAFARPIDVTAIVRQLSVASGIRHVGFNIRKGNNRQGPGLFTLSAGKLTVVLADHAVAAPPHGPGTGGDAGRGHGNRRPAAPAAPTPTAASTQAPVKQATTKVAVAPAVPPAPKATTQKTTSAKTAVTP